MPSTDSHHLINELVDYLQTTPASVAENIDHPDPDVNRLSEAERRRLRQASVLLAITRATQEQESSLVLTLRSEKLNSHAGQVSLPGGSRDPGDTSSIETALRESEEEIGLLRQDVEVIGQLGNMALPSGFYITPVVGLIDAGLDFVPCPIEVAEIFQAPLELILNPNSYQKSTMTYKRRATRIVEIQYGKFRIWGATAAILYHLAKELESYRGS